MSNYVYGSSLAYRDYLQAKSFEDSLKSEISKQARLIIASTEQLRHCHFSAAASLRKAVSEGFEELSLDLRSLTEGVGELTAAFHWGMSELLISVGHVNDTLAALVKMAKTPAQTWAYEQFEIARDAFRQELYPESLEYLNRAINGYVGNTGYKLEYRFHFLLGTIRLGSARNTSPEILSLPEAESAFVNAARYARKDEPKEAGRALLAAGWAAYCQGKMDVATQHTNDALSLYPELAEGHFQLAKIRMHCGEPTKALTPLRKAIELERGYAIKASADDDFKPYQTELNTLLNSLLREAKKRADTTLLAVQRQTVSVEQQRVQEFSFAAYAKLSDLKRTIDDAASAHRTNTYFGYLDALSHCKVATEALRRATTQSVTSARADIQQKIAAVNGEINDVNGGKHGLPWFGLFCLGGLVSVVVGFVQCGKTRPSIESLTAFVGNVFIFGLLSAILAAIGYNTQKSSSIASLKVERERLEKIDLEIQDLWRDE